MEKRNTKKKTGKTSIALKDSRRKYICIICPNCCKLETDGKNVVGARCKEGQAFALQEWIEPLRVLTTAVRCETERGVKILPVKTVTPVPLSRTPAIMKEIKTLRLSKIPPIGSKITVRNLEEPLDIVITGE